MDNQGQNGLSDLSPKIQRLCQEDITRYVEKIEIVGGVDPYCMEFDSTILPLTVDYDQIFCHLINKLSFRTGAPNRNIKSLDAYKGFQRGFVKEVKGCRHEQAFVISGKVLHSMCLNVPPAECWIIINDMDSEEHEVGSILAAHCDCTAGAGETCSHVSAVLYALSYAREICLGKRLSVTELPAYWTQPGGSSADQDLYKPIDEVRFGRKRETACELRDYNLERTDEDYKNLIKDIAESGQNVAASHAFFLQQEVDEEYPERLRERERLTSLSLLNSFENSNKAKTLDELIALGKDRNWRVTSSDCHFIEKMTREQHAEPLWFKLRYGRITASNFARCVKTSITKPSKSLLRTIFSENEGQSMPATLHGRRNEHKGVAAAVDLFNYYKHTNLSSRKCGLVISPDYPYFAASPDYIISCDCCGTVVIEVKCPFRFDNLTREEGINVLVNRQQPYIIRNNGGGLSLNQRHQYYFQVQLQILLAQASYGMFVVWAPNFTLYFKIQKNRSFWDEYIPKAETFFENVLAPEILGNYFSSRFEC